MASENWEESRAKLLAAASSASAAVTDLVEASRSAGGRNLTRPNMLEILTQLNDALRLAIEVGADPWDYKLLRELEEWLADHE